MSSSSSSSSSSQQPAATAPATGLPDDDSSMGAVLSLHRYTEQAFCRHTVMYCCRQPTTPSILIMLEIRMSARTAIKMKKNDTDRATSRDYSKSAEISINMHEQQKAS